MDPKKHHKVVIQIAVVMAFVFGVMTAIVAYFTNSLEMGIIFLLTLSIIVLLSILYVVESILEVLEVKL